MAEHNEFGKNSEELACSFLIKKGYEILARNFHFQKAEIDIIAKYDGHIIIIEVKARATDVFLEPHEAVNKRKIRFIVNAADEFLKQGDYQEEVRFDIISVLKNKEGIPKITHIENAFDAFDAN